MAPQGKDTNSGKYLFMEVKQQNKLLIAQRAPVLFFLSPIVEFFKKTLRGISCLLHGRKTGCGQLTPSPDTREFQSACHLRVSYIIRFDFQWVLTKQVVTIYKKIEWLI